MIFVELSIKVRGFLRDCPVSLGFFVAPCWLALKMSWNIKRIHQHELGVEWEHLI